MPTSLETLRRHRAAHADAHASKRVWLYHSHTYFDGSSPAETATAKSFRERIGQTFASSGHVELNAFVPMAVGPHPRASFEVLFTREVFAEYVSWLMFERPPSLSVLVHPLTASQVNDHGQHALWLGEQLAISYGILEQSDANAIAKGRSEESIIEGTKKH